MGQLNIKDLKLCMVEVLLVEVCGSTMCKSLLSSAENQYVLIAFRSGQVLFLQMYHLLRTTKRNVIIFHEVMKLKGVLQELIKIDVDSVQIAFDQP